MHPDVFGIIDSLKVNWDKAPGGNEWLTEIVHLVILEVYICGEVTE